jgi:hypothetical protein
MTKLILLCLVLSSNIALAQSSDLDTSPASVDDLLLEDSDAPETVTATPEEVAPVANPEKDVPAVIPDSTESTEMVNSEANDTKEEPSLKHEVTSNPPATEVDTPNPLETRSDQPGGLKDYVTGTVPYDAHRIKHHASHWLTTFAFEGQKYNLPFVQFTGDRKHIGPRDQELYGARLGIGGQIYLGKGFFTTSMLSVFYNGTLFTKTQEAGPEVDGQQVGTLHRTSGFSGGDIAQQLGYIFEFKTKNPFMDEWARLTFEPFLEAGLGVGSSYNKVNYAYDSGEVNEKYKYTIEDKVTYAKAGGGFNMTAGNGFFFQVKAMVNTMNITERKTQGFTRKTSDPTATIFSPETSKNAKMDPVTVFTLGGGYKF